MGALPEAYRDRLEAALRAKLVRSEAPLRQFGEGFLAGLPR